MGVINLHSKYAKKIATAFVKGSLLQGRLSNDYDFTGVRTAKISTPLTVPLNDYKRSGNQRYGETKEMEDTIQELTMSQDKSFSLSVDKGNNADQNGIKAAGRMTALEIKEQVIPEMDRYSFERLAYKAGRITSGVAISKTNICDRISDGTEVLDDAEVPDSDRTLYISNACYKMLKHSDEFLKNDELGQKALAKGQVGEYDNMAVVKVPRRRQPPGFNFLIVHKSSACAPAKIYEHKLHTDPQGVSGNLMEGRFYYDCFVIGTRCDGIYYDADSTVQAALAAPTVNAATGAITGTGTATYTTDGSDPRYSSTAQTGNAPQGVAAGTVVRAFLSQDKKYPSPVTTVKCTG